MSVADVAIVPLQDILGLGSEARMNLPGRPSGNWRWRFEVAALAGPPRDRLRELTALYGRRPFDHDVPD
jgi:4-alpha-glucanotransferase